MTFADPVSAPVSAPNASGAILDAAIERLAESTPSGMTINEICKRVGVRPPAIYYHFGSKEGLVSAAVETAGNAWLEALRAQLPAGGTFEETLVAALDGWQALIESPSRPIKLLLSVQLESAESSPEIRAALQRVHDHAREIIRLGIAASTGQTKNLDRIAETVLGLVQAAAIHFHLDGDRTALRARLDELGRTLSLLVDQAS
jgi:AcrR family transcriptional regulator